MSDTRPDYLKYLDPNVLAQIGSLELRAQMIVEGLMAGKHSSAYHGPSVEFAQYRPYAPGDDIRHVDWKVFARTDKIYLKQYQKETDLEVISLVDTSESMNYSSMTEGRTAWSKFDHATAIAASLSYLVLRQQDSAGAAVFDRSLGQYCKPSNSPAQWKHILDVLTQVPRTQKTDMGRILEQLAEKLVRKSLIILLSDFFDNPESIRRGLSQLRFKRHAIMAFQILDPAEIEFPFAQTTLFKGLEASGQLIASPQELRDGYLEALRRSTDQLRQICQEMGVKFYRADSSRSIGDLLAMILA